MEIFILEDMNELEAAKVMLGGLLATGRIRDPEERRFLEGRLEEIERRLQGAEAAANALEVSSRVSNSRRFSEGF